ncbi:MAG: hypothetical protein E7080_09750 [Bacteroidales bacterium]|nr:hypothetical protein [Bacteroidales bacterium]
MVQKISIVVPKSWQELTDTQLYYIYNLFAYNLSLGQIKTFCLMKWGKMKALHRYGDGYMLQQGKTKFVVTAELLADAIHALDWIDELPSSPVRISSIYKAKALDAAFIGVPLEKFLYCDNLYQGYLETQNHALLVQMAEVLYDKENIKINQAEKISIFYWWATLKSLLSRSFPTFLQPMPVGMDNLLDDNNIGKRLQDAMNAQIRALTKGDITKEKEVLAMDTWRAMTELEAQAKEYEEIKRKYGN